MNTWIYCLPFLVGCITNWTLGSIRKDEGSTNVGTILWWFAVNEGFKIMIEVSK